LYLSFFESKKMIGVSCGMGITAAFSGNKLYVTLIYPKTRKYFIGVPLVVLYGPPFPPQCLGKLLEKFFKLNVALNMSSLSSENKQVTLNYLNYLTLKIGETEVYAMGANNYGQTADVRENRYMGTQDTEFAEITALSGKEIVSIAAGGWHSVALSGIFSFYVFLIFPGTGNLYTWGYNYYGACMHPETYQNIHSPYEINLKNLAEKLNGDTDIFPIANISAGNHGY
jgi:hypothetical protein